ncbi:MAG: MgtC/SapB family protein [Candidatus Xenobiia bacterium LiM19]
MPDNSMLMISEKDIVIRLIIGAFLGALIGLERERHSQPAGLRTHMILSIGCTLAMCLSIDLAMEFRNIAPNGDPARLAAQVISGIGFLGAGAILKLGTNVKGLTTATSLWTVAIIGLAVGAGHFFSGIFSTALLLTILTIIDFLEKRYLTGVVTREISLKCHDRENLVNDIRMILIDMKMTIKSICVEKSLETNDIDIDIIVRAPDKQNMDEIIEKLSSTKDVKSFDIH